MRKVPKALGYLIPITSPSPQRRSKYYRGENPALLKPTQTRPSALNTEPTFEVLATPPQSWREFLLTMGDGNLGRAIDDRILIAMHQFDVLVGFDHVFHDPVFLKFRIWKRRISGFQPFHNPGPGARAIHLPSRCLKDGHVLTAADRAQAIPFRGQFTCQRTFFELLSKLDRTIDDLEGGGPRPVGGKTGIQVSAHMLGTWISRPRGSAILAGIRQQVLYSFLV